MSTINQFQQYSQKENVTTNNILLMFSLLYEINPKYYNAIISSLIEDSNSYDVLPEFKQQVGNNGNGIIDGHIVVKSSSIIIETKLHGVEWIDKLIKYTDTFPDHGSKILFLLSKDKYTKEQCDDIKNQILIKHPNGGIVFHSITYDQLVDELGSLYNSFIYDAQLRRLYEHFLEYCQDSNLLAARHILRAMACGQSFALNIKHRFYFDWHSRGYSHFNYLGIYYWKAVRHIGRIENVILADYDYTSGKLEVKESSQAVTPEQEQRLIAAIIEADSLGWGISENHRFFLLEDFNDTHFEKTSPGGIFRVRFFNLEDYLGKGLSENVGEIAEVLRTKTWI